MQTFYDPTINNETVFHALSEDESHHACRVLHKKAGDIIGVLNGKGLYAEALILDHKPLHCRIEILSKSIEKKPNFSVHIAIAPTKINERIEWFVEKATEIGINEISFLFCRNSVRKSIKIERLQNIAISAMKQSKRLFLPKLNQLMPFELFLQNNNGGYIADCFEGRKQDLDKIYDKFSPILIGPEGDFTIDEIEKAKKFNYKEVTLSKNTLRTETAGLFACMQALLKS